MAFVNYDESQGGRQWVDDEPVRCLLCRQQEDLDEHELCKSCAAGLR